MSSPIPPRGGDEVSESGMDPAGAGSVVAHLLLAAGGMLAATLRVVSYAGPPRPWRVVAFDATVQAIVAFGVGETAIGFGVSPHAAFGLAILTGIVGWEVVKQVAASRARKAK